ncbi:MAG: tRNA (adenosine(37)-N6)-threonylcarbamoyltransferase complex ATPase subunit type 1 TsaE [candidate division Zixibacteria bacterium]|nr:tRNA (adenosine(37)-N6)-threonylcarbamoyltransferase complex ATPase subunit type 1 TsaE [candidate division Zixibacteria bacterium]
MNSATTPSLSPAGAHVTKSEAETELLATAFAHLLNPGTWVGLIGPLGSGKSVFARAVGRAWGVEAAMPSPTYTLMNCLVGRCPIYHMDLYRIESADELDFAGLTPYFSLSGICLVEWAEKAHSLWPATGWTVTFDQLDEYSRRIEIASFRNHS